MQRASRRETIEAYVKYDACKKNRQLPVNFSQWPWLDPNALDGLLRDNGFKPGVVSGYKTWRIVELSRNDLLQCAIWNGIFKNLPQTLSVLVNCPQFKQWCPNEKTKWFDLLESGQPYPNDWPLILRPAKKSEAPAKWYIEDGSGRTICYLRRLLNHPEENGKAKAYLGEEIDWSSHFMKEHFREFLN
jgi:hypothetical protein